jgi:DHA2 family multidrug resistance protein
MGGEMGTAFVSTWARVRGQVASNLIGQHVRVGDGQVVARVRAYGAATTRVLDPQGAMARGGIVLGNVVRAAATTQAVMDGFVAISFMTAIALLIVVFRSAAPEGPASAAPLFPSRGAKSP